MIDISKSINKVDDDDKITGKALFLDDIKFDDLLYAKTFRSDRVHAKIINRNYPEIPSGYYIIDYKDIPNNNYIQIIYEDMPVFAKDEVNYFGEPILLVVGKEREIIECIIKEINIEYEDLKPIYEYKESVINYKFKKGIKIENFNSYKKIKFEYKTNYQEHIYIEPQGVMGYLRRGKLTIMGSIQCPYYVKDALVNTLGYEKERVRVIQTTTGGAFGGKEEFPSLMACQIAVAINKVKKPIKLVYDRKEDIMYSTKRHPSNISLEALIDKENNIKELKVYISLNAGAYIGLSGVVLERAMISASGVYAIENLDVKGEVFITNTVPTGAFRGFGAPQMIFAIEMFMNHISKELKIDSLLFRKNHLVKKGDLTSTSGVFRNEIIISAMIKKAEEISNYNEKMIKYSSEKEYKGIGMSLFLHGCGFTGSGEKDHIKATVKLEKNNEGIVTILIASVDMGQGIKTTMKKIVSNILEIKIDNVVLNNPDTDLVPDSGPTVASRTIMIVGGLVARAAKELKETWVDNENQLITKHYKQPEYMKWDEEKMIGDAYPAYSFGVNVVEVEVNPISYEVSVNNTWSVYDVGKAIDERIVIGQVDGGLLQAIGYGTIEVMNNKDGKIYQNTISDYVIPTSKDTPNMETIIMDNPYLLGPYGAKGAGELGILGGAPAVSIAIENAINKRVSKIPVTPEYIMELMK